MDERDTLIRQQLEFIQMALMPRIVTQEPTLRDHFAMASLPVAAQGIGFLKAPDIATMAYELADAMLAAREADHG